MNLRYQGYDKAGTRVEGVIEAPGAEQAKDLLRKRGVFASDIAPAPEGAGAPGITGSASQARVSGKNLRRVAAFTKQMAVLVGTGTPVLDAVNVLEKQARDEEWRGVLGDLRRRVEEGAAFSSALEAHPRYFDGVCRSLVLAGESRGNLGEMLRSLSDLTRQQLKIRSAFLGAMVYPCLLIVIAVAVIVTMLVFVLPRFEGLFANLNTPVPGSTQFLLALGKGLREHWIPICAMLGVGIGGLVFWLSTGSGRRAVQIAMVRVPKVGALTRAFVTARVARLLGVLLDGKVSLLESLHLTRMAAGNVLYERLLDRAADAVQKGLPVSDALGDTSSGELVTPSVVEGIRSGERTGTVGPVLKQLADFMDEDNEVVVKSLTSILEPMILIVLGGVVGLVAISMFLPLFDLTSGAGAGGAGPGGGGAP